MAELTLSFADIERIIGAMLPKAALRPEWWGGAAGSQPDSVQSAAWKGAGYDALLIGGDEQVRFSRIARDR